MRISRTTATLALSGTLALAMAAPAMAQPEHGQHTSCKEFGTGFAAWVQSADADFDGNPDEVGEAGQWMAANARGTGIADVIHHEQYVGIGFGPMCDLKDH